MVSVSLVAMLNCDERLRLTQRRLDHSTRQKWTLLETSRDSMSRQDYFAAAASGTSITCQCGVSVALCHKSPQASCRTTWRTTLASGSGTTIANTRVRLVFLQQLRDRRRHPLLGHAQRFALRRTERSPVAPAIGDRLSAASTSRRIRAFPATNRDRGSRSLSIVFTFRSSACAKALGRLLGRLQWARVDGRDRLPAQLFDHRLDFLPAIFAKRNVERSLHATLLVVFGRCRGESKVSEP